jgi:hypothetical protein
VWILPGSIIASSSQWAPAGRWRARINASAWRMRSRPRVRARITAGIASMAMMSVASRTTRMFLAALPTASTTLVVSLVFSVRTSRTRRPRRIIWMHLTFLWFQLNVISHFSGIF